MDDTTLKSLAVVAGVVQTLGLAWIAAWQRKQLQRAERRQARLVDQGEQTRAEVAKVQETLKKS